MRKKTVKFVADTIFWYVLYFLPVISYLLFMFIHPSGTGGIEPLSFMTFLSDTGFTIITDNVIYQALFDIFGTGGMLPFFDSPVIFTCLTWFVAVFIAHLFVDFVLFIPRLAHKWLNAFTQGDVKN